MTDEKGYVNPRSFWTVLWGAVIYMGGPVAFLSLVGLVLSWASHGTYHIVAGVVHFDDMRTQQERTVNDVAAAKAQLDNLTNLVKQDIEQGEETARDLKSNHDSSVKWRTEVGDQIGSLQTDVGNLENRVQHLEGTTTHAFGALATSQDDIAYGKCCTMHNCKSYDGPCAQFKRRN